MSEGQEGPLEAGSPHSPHLSYGRKGCRADLEAGIVGVRCSAAAIRVNVAGAGLMLYAR